MSSSDRRKVTTRRLQEMKESSVKIACLTAYDHLLASILDQAGIDVILIGDSAGTVFAGYDTTTGGAGSCGRNLRLSDREPEP